MSEILAAIAIVISLVALAVAWWNGSSARRSADAAEGSQHAADRSADAAMRVADVESQRRHAETRPRYKIEILSGDDPIFEYFVRLTLVEHGPVQDLLVEVLSPAEVEIYGRKPGDTHPVREAHLGKLSIGETRQLPLRQIDDIAYSRVRLLITSVSEQYKSPWIQVEDLNIPRPWHD
ncbi:hypothetical protein M1L60_10805 [Actinoplanes sp. TRM 88003]|uniref:Uncharacterized protein n=1 Tax=Paractinoplanes aksuensis TaxID=2939490 RepID=A0ABT1DJR4_9ACTN|nr:hypothetical protein [Actinoplanes aksuensis]MCO8271082.1 hypothetical protein [Actinoplanes aksuensis]